MDDIAWFEDIPRKDTASSPEEWAEEIRYTLYQKDFLQMPDLDFGELTEVDPSLRALLN
jgi:hypothetical protein